MSAVIIPTVTADMFGGRSFGIIFGVMTRGLSVGGALGAWAAGLAFDRTRNYRSALALAGLAGLLSVLAIWLIAPHHVLSVRGRSLRRAAPPTARASGS